MKHLVKEDYLAKARTLPEIEQERVLSRMTGKLPKRLDKEKLTREEAIAIQMEIEDEQLNEWRQRMHELQAKATAKAEKEAKKETKPKKAAAKSSKKDAGKAKASAEPAIVTEKPAVLKTTKAPLPRPATVKTAGASKATATNSSKAPTQKPLAKTPETAS